ncbi:hypothetical protein BBJ29_004121 [Phytophthora kernoviae]|uniref:Cell division control protein 24 OB domain-containing protein n=1 Tax=Phytophthora kernoviae TaxID=325452 RepID=A0A3F2RWH6_9STRA|nr:hypothetical protein BBJ29_004121 [Phytophthora kernoviae]RLN65618.1 hypothetical protein BBP00_00002748 [Phytophthora kernoviae]
MELLDAIEELEEQVPVAHYDFVERQVLFVQQRLRELWQRKHGDAVKSPIIPFYWIFSKLLHLIEEYPDGLTEAVVVTELATLLQLRKISDGEQEVGNPRKRRKVRNDGDMGDLLEEWEQEALDAKILGYENHRLTIEMENIKNITAYIYLHQRFRSLQGFSHFKLIE